MAASRLRLNMDNTELMWTDTKRKRVKDSRLLTFFDSGWCPSCRIRCCPCPWSPTDAGFVPWQARHCNCAASDALSTTTRPLYSRPGVRRQPGRLLWQSLDRCAKEDDRQAAACAWWCAPNRLKYTQVRSRVESVPATRAPLAGCRWPGSVQTVCPGVQVSQHGAWIPVDSRHSAGRLPANLQTPSQESRPSYFPH